MMNRTSIVRRAIKLRKPIYRDFCSCYGVGVLSVEGIPHLVMADNLTIKGMESYLNNVCTSTAIYLSHNTPDYRSKALMCLDRGLPVTINTKGTLDNDLLESLRKVPHSSIHVSTDFLGKSSGNSPGVKLFEEELREMMFLAKSWKIFVGVYIEYFPHIVSKLDLFEACEMVRNICSHVMIDFPDITDELYHENRHIWADFKKYYHAFVPARTWHINWSYRDKLLEELHTFLKLRKISMENISMSDVGRIRHVQGQYSGSALGLNPVYYIREGNEFVPSEELSEEPCKTCGRTLLS